jgi:dihydroorotate dehydrogenase
MIYAGPSLPGRIVRGMLKTMEAEGAQSPFELRDSRLEHWAAQPI